MTEKYRPIYEKQAKENQRLSGIEYGNGGTKVGGNLPQPLSRDSRERNPKTSEKLASIANVSEKPSQNSSKAINKIDVRAKLAETAGVSTDTYSKGAKIPNSGK